MRIAVPMWLRRSSGLALIAGASLVGVTDARAEAGALYRWETADGTVAFTDDPKRVPARYQDAAAVVDRGMLTDYGRFSAVDGAANEESARQLAERLAALRAANASTEIDAAEPEHSAPPGAVAAPRDRDVYRREFTRKDDRGKDIKYWRYYDDGGSVPAASLPVDPNDPNPVVTERQRVSVPGQTVTETVTVVRQGDRVLSVERPPSTYHKTDYPSLDELLEQ